MRVALVGSDRDIDARALWDAAKALGEAGHQVHVATTLWNHDDFDPAEYLEGLPDDTKVALVPLWQTCSVARDIVRALRENTNFTFITAWGGHEVHWARGAEDSIEHTLGDQIPEYKGGKW